MFEEVATAIEAFETLSLSIRLDSSRIIFIRGLIKSVDTIISGGGDCVERIGALLKNWKKIGGKKIFFSLCPILSLASGCLLSCSQPWRIRRINYVTYVVTRRQSPNGSILLEELITSDSLASLSSLGRLLLCTCIALIKIPFSAPCGPRWPGYTPEDRVSSILRTSWWNEPGKKLDGSNDYNDRYNTRNIFRRKRIDRASEITRLMTQ